MRLTSRIGIYLLLGTVGAGPGRHFKAVQACAAALPCGTQADELRARLHTWPAAFSPSNSNLSSSSSSSPVLAQALIPAPRPAQKRPITTPSSQVPSSGPLQPRIKQEYHPSGTKGGPMLFVPAGRFWMGCYESGEIQCLSNEIPYHPVDLKAFFIDKYEVTQSDYLECVQALGCPVNVEFPGFTAASQPVVGVSWGKAEAYCALVGKRLPTEAEWEKAARGMDGRRYPWGNSPPTCRLAVLNDKEAGCGRRQSWEVGSLPAGASPVGALDLAGNVWEWISDWYQRDYYQGTPLQNPVGPSKGTKRVIRGGSWFSVSPGWYRAGMPPNWADQTIGFRCAHDYP